MTICAAQKHLFPYVISKLSEADSGILDEPVDKLRVKESPLIGEHLRQVPVVEGDDRLDALGLQRRDEVPVILDAGLIHCPGRPVREGSRRPVGEYSGPGDGESVVADAHRLQKLDVLLVLVVAVAGHLGGGAIENVSRGGRPSVPYTQ